MSTTRKKRRSGRRANAAAPDDAATPTTTGDGWEGRRRAHGSRETAGGAGAARIYVDIRGTMWASADSSTIRLHRIRLLWRRRGGMRPFLPKLHVRTVIVSVSIPAVPVKEVTPTLSSGVGPGTLLLVLKILLELFVRGEHRGRCVKCRPTGGRRSEREDR